MIYEKPLFRFFQVVLLTTLLAPGCGDDGSGEVPVCGNGVVEGNEWCDDGNTANNDGCSSGCIEEFCGDGVIQSGIGEQCDDGNNSDGDGCSSFCQNEGGAVCGNGQLESGELSLEESLKMFDEGIKLTEFCNKKLTEARTKVNILLKKNGGLETEPFTDFDPDD